MYKEISQLIIYRDLNKNSILYNLGEIFRKFDEVSLTKDELIKLLSFFYKFDKIRICGITGTDGKTTTSTIINYLLSSKYNH